MSITKPTALKLILDPPDRLRVLFREQCNPLTLQAADQLARRRDVSESQRRNRSLVDDEQRKDNDGGPREGHLGTCVGAICAEAQALGATQGYAGDYGEDDCCCGGDGGDG